MLMGEKALGCPVEIEFAVNINEKKYYTSRKNRLMANNQKNFLL